MLKDADKKPDEEIYRSERVLSTEASAPWSRGAPPSQYGDMFASLEALQGPDCWDSYGRFMM